MVTSSGEVIIEAQGDTFEQAEAWITEQLPPGLRILSVNIIQYGYTDRPGGAATLIEDAFAEADEQVPQGAEVLERRVLNSPSREIVVVEAHDEDDAVETALDKLDKERASDENGHRIVEGVRLVATGRRKLLGIGKAEPKRYEVEVLQLATVEVSYAVKYRISAMIGVPPELSRQDIQLLHDLLAMFSANGRDVLGDSELERQYVNWWYKNQGVAPALENKLKVLSETGTSPVLNKAQASQMHWLLVPQVTDLTSPAPLSEDEIKNVLHIGYHVWMWKTGHDMTVIGAPGGLSGDLLFNECLRALAAALETAPPSGPMPECNNCSSRIDHFGFTQADAAWTLSRRGQPGGNELRRALMRSVGGSCPGCGRICCAKCYYDHQFTCPHCTSKIPELA